VDWSNPIVYELGLTIVAAVGFWIWQTRDLKRAARELKDKEDAANLADAAPAPPSEPR
jgi:hypothetical protein